MRPRARSGGDRDAVRVVHVTTVPESLLFLRGQAAYMRAHGVELQALSSPGPRLEDFAARDAVPVHAVAMARRVTPLRDLVALFRIWRALRSIRPDIVHAHTPKGGLLGILAGWLARTPVLVYHLRGLPLATATGYRRVLLRWSERVSCGLADRVLCVSPSLRLVAIEERLCAPAKIAVPAGGSGNGVDAAGRFAPARVGAEARAAARRRHGLPDGEPVVGFVGRIVRDKGVVELMQAWAALREEFPRLHLLVVGPFERQDAVPPEVEARMRADPRVHLAGVDWDTPPLYASMDVVVLPTYREGFPNVPLEAAAMELPVVATRVAGCVDAVDDGVTGTLVPPRDATALAAAVRRYLVDPGLRARHGGEGRRRVLREFAPEAIWESLRGEYARLLDGRRATGPGDVPARAPAAEAGAARGGRGLTRPTLAGLFWAASGKVAYAVVSLGVLAVLARLLAPSDFGVVGAALVVVNLGLTFSQLGLGPALIQRSRIGRTHIRAAWTASLLFCALAGAAAWLSAPVVAAFFRTPAVAPVLRALSWSFPLAGLGVVSDSLANRQLRFRWLAQRDVIAYAVGYGAVAVALALLGFGYWALVWGTLAQTALRSALLLLAHPVPGWWRPRLRGLGELMHFGTGQAAAETVNYLALQSDKVVVGRWLGAAALGLYGRAYQLTALPAYTVGGIVNRVLFPTLSRIHEDRERLRSAYTRGAGTLAAIMLPASALVLVLAPELVRTLLGAGWGEVVLPARALAVSMFFRTGYKLCDSLLTSAGAVYRQSARKAAYVLLVLGASWAGHTRGIGGVAVAVSIALGLNFLLMAQLTLSVVRLPWRRWLEVHRPGLRLAVVTAAACAPAAEVLRRVGAPAAVTLLGAGAAALAVAAPLVFRFPAVFVGAHGASLIRELRGLLRERRLASAIRAPGASPGGAR